MEELKKAVNRLKWDRIITAVIAIVVGILFIAVPEGSANLLCTIAGILLIAAGVAVIAMFISYGYLTGGFMLVSGLAILMAGLFCILHPEVVGGILTLLFGLYIIVDGSSMVAQSIECAKVKIQGWPLLLILSLLIVALGAVVMFGTFDTVMIFAGISLIADGVCSLITTLLFKKKLKEAKKRIHEMFNTVYIDE